ncbi:MAG: hypothetical protein NVSMB3_13060 [Acidobacteriaceae bacterium]
MIPALALLALATTLSAQIPGDLNPPPKARGYITYAAEPQVVPAGKRTVLELHFRVAPGFHVNSHNPSSELLIPTELTMQPTGGVTAGKLEYPAGAQYSFASQPAEKLDVYTGNFNLRLPVEASPGEHTLTGILHYQACDHAACYPPESLPVQVLFTAK